MRTLTDKEKSVLLENHQKTQDAFKVDHPDKEMKPFIYYVPEDFMHFLMAHNKGIPPKISEEFSFIDDLLPLPEEYKTHQYIIVVNGEKYFYDFPVKGV
ncbi:hypothetical protein KIH41_09405 [Litoribacter ruber]|uniref:Uncharacterized protein n=1 Tax=Litoribacter ruber TaxID=702568 RepID=A0AAP2G1C2_9BACT|nr:MULTISPECIES: hypothetical protein [Litoribacter]MBS9523912.1 hypothetical protein [Litoribacter alkaliphilus]MBT0811493.1 hypothetical protein [Litoribacter ruber]